LLEQIAIGRQQYKASTILERFGTFSPKLATETRNAVCWLQQQQRQTNYQQPKKANPKTLPCSTAD